MLAPLLLALLSAALTIIAEDGSDVLLGTALSLSLLLIMLVLVGLQTIHENKNGGMWIWRRGKNSGNGVKDKLLWLATTKGLLQILNRTVQ